MIFLCFLPFLSPAIALFAGLLFSLFGIRHATIHRFTSPVLQLSIVLMGFGMSLSEVITASKTGFVATAISVVSVMILGILLGKLFRVEKNITLLIATGTAICGGSAIAAVAPILNSKSYQNSFALVVVFVLNAVALFLFAILFANFFPELHASYDHFSWLGKRGMVIALFLIGSNITLGEIKQSGPRSFALGITLWVLTAVGSLFFLIR